MRYYSVWQKNHEKIEANFRKKLDELNNRIRDKILEAGVYQNLYFEQRVILQEILAICKQEQMQHIGLDDKLRKIEKYARRALETKR